MSQSLDHSENSPSSEEIEKIKYPEYTYIANSRSNLYYSKEEAQVVDFMFLNKKYAIQTEGTSEMSQKSKVSKVGVSQVFNEFENDLILSETNPSDHLMLSYELV